MSDQDPVPSSVAPGRSTRRFSSCDSGNGYADDLCRRAEEAAAGAVIAPSSSSDLAGRLRAVEAVKDRMVSMAVRRLPGDATRAVLHAFVKQLEAALRDPVLPVRSQDQDTKEETRRDGDTASRPTGSSRSQPKGSQR